MHRSKLVAIPCLLLLLVASAVSLAACGGGSSSSSSAESTESSEPAETEEGTGEAKESDEGSEESSSGFAAATIKLGMEFTGGTEGAADPSLDPITIGYVNQEGQAFSFLEMKAAAEAAVSFANEQLGGIEGHPIKLLTCALTNAEAQQRCAVQMLDAKVPVVNLGLSSENPAAFTKTLNGKVPLQVALATGTAEYTAKNTYAFNSVPALFYGMSKNAQEHTSESEPLAIVQSDVPGGRLPLEQIMLPTLKNLGVPVNKVTYFPPGTVSTPEMVSALQSAGATGAGAVNSTLFEPAECIAVYNALKQLAVTAPFIASSGCANSEAFEEAIGSGPENWSVWSYGPIPQAESPETQAFKEIMEADGQDEYIYQGFAGQGMGSMMAIIKVANEIGAEKLTPEAVNSKLSTFKGNAFMWAPGIDCSDPWEKSEPAVCGSSVVGSEYKEGSWQSLGSVSLREGDYHLGG
jgi:branched-chain amino acid transport system substrate-binding protein